MNKFKKTRKFSLDETVENVKFDFCKNLKWFLIAPILIALVGVVMLCSFGFNLGIDFTGGSNITIYVDNEGTYGTQLDIEKDASQIRTNIQNVLDEYGLKITTIQDTTMSSKDGDRDTFEDHIAIIVKYQNDNSLSTEQIEAINEEIRLKLLKEFGFISSIDGLTVDDLDTLDEAEFVTYGGVTTASASSELMMKSFIALLVAVVLILVYVAFRFEITSGLAAILALFHDVIVTASIVLICRIQINVSFIAALITILGYSINNTIIIFDRMRDKLKIAKASNEKIDNTSVANQAIKDTMLRSILTGITTFVMIFMITVIGVADIREFAFPIMIGILAGFYSSVFITPGLWSIAYRPRKRKSTYVAQQKQEEKEIEVVDAE